MSYDLNSVADRLAYRTRRLTRMLYVVAVGACALGVGLGLLSREVFGQDASPSCQYTQEFVLARAAQMGVSVRLYTGAQGKGIGAQIINLLSKANEKEYSETPDAIAMTNLPEEVVSVALFQDACYVGSVKMPLAVWEKIVEVVGVGA